MKKLRNTAKRMPNHTKIFLLCLALTSFSACAYAQTGGATPPGAQDIINQANNDVGGGLDQLSAPAVSLSVSVSGPVGSTATLSASTDNINQSTATFEWYVDDQATPSLSGFARTTFSFVTQKPLHLVRVVVLVGGNKVAENTVSVQSFNVALAWYADTFVPAAYDAKALPSVGSRVTVSALPEIKNENPDDLLYTWYLDAESQVRNISGEQDFTFVVTKNVSSVSVMVDVSNQSQSIQIRKAIVIPVVRPSVVLSPSTPVSVARTAKTTIQALPFYFHIGTLNQLSYAWTFLGTLVYGVPPDPNVLSLIIPQSSNTGTEWLSLEVKNQSIPEEQADAQIQVTVL